MTILPELMAPSLYRVHETRAETKDTFTLELEPVDEGAGRFSFAAGQFNMLYAYGVGEVPISLSGDPEEANGRPIHTIRQVGAVTQALCRLKPDGMLGLRGPFGTGWPVDEAVGRDVVVMAGGIGLAPLRPALYQLMRWRDRYKKIILIYGARSPEDIVFGRELAAWAKGKGIEVTVTVDRASAKWKGNVGLVTTFLAAADFDSAKATVMVCGPEIMMRFAIKEFQKRGVAERNLFLSMERNMKCAIGFCGHCQYGPSFICKDGPVFRYDRIKDLFWKREI